MASRPERKLPPPRLLASIRLSYLTKSTTSPIRQREEITETSESINATIIDWIEDLNVSASKKNLKSRKGLSPWLTEKVHLYDGIIWQRLDRAVRKMADLSELLSWARTNKKVLKFCSGLGAELDLDFREGRTISPMTHLVIMLAAFAAEIEADSISDRALSSHNFLRALGIYHGGRVPFGYQPEKYQDPRFKEPRWKLVLDPKSSTWVRQIIRDLFQKKSLTEVVRELNEKGIPTGLDYQQYWKMNEAERAAFKPRKWSVAALRIMMASRALLGEAVHEGAAVLDENGDPVLQGEPLISIQEWNSLQEIMKSASFQKGSAKRDNLLLDVLYHATCGSKIYFSSVQGKKTKYPYGRCARYRDYVGTGHPCSKQIRLDEVEEFVTERFLLQVGQLPALRKEFVEGNDKGEEIASVRRRIEALSDQHDLGILENEEEYVSRRRRLNGILDDLKATHSESSGWVWKHTGKTYSELWTALDIPARRQLLLEADIKIFAGRTGLDLSSGEGALDSLRGDTDLGGLVGAAQCDLGHDLTVFLIWAPNTQARMAQHRINMS